MLTYDSESSMLNAEAQQLSRPMQASRELSVRGTRLLKQPFDTKAADLNDHADVATDSHGHDHGSSS